MTDEGAVTIITVRHSVTAHNAAQVITGRLDEPLSDEGRALAHETAARVRFAEASLVVASPTRRAVETAILLTGRPRDEIVNDRLCVERDYGLLQGLDRQQVARYSDRISYVEVGGIRHSLNPPGGESFDEVRRRAEAFYVRLRARADATVIVVSHQVFLQQLHGLLLGLAVIPSLGRDIQPLQVDRFVVQALPAEHALIDSGVRRHVSW